MSIEREHAKMACRLSKDGREIVNSLSPIKAHLLHMVVGVSGEAGELLDAVKKFVIYNQPLDEENVVEELGDLEFYLAEIRRVLVISRYRVLEHNLAKLNKRYGKEYSDKSALVRKDKNHE